MKNIMLTTAICVGSIVMTGTLINHKMFECSAAKAVLQPTEVKAVAVKTQPEAHYASFMTPENKFEKNTTVNFSLNMSNMLDEQLKADEEINDDFIIEHLPLLDSTTNTDDEMNDLFLSENSNLKFSPNFLASDDEMNSQFHAENK